MAKHFVERIGDGIIGGAMIYGVPLMILAVLSPRVVLDYWILYLVACGIPLLIGIPLIVLGRKMTREEGRGGAN